jgi:transcription antitermination factor NusB
LAEILESSGEGDRRRAREYALQLLFQIDISREELSVATESFWQGKRVRKSIQQFARELVDGTVRYRDWLDEVLGKISHHWRVNRMAVVDRNVLRLALFEMLVAHATPPIVVINEAIEIAKKFGNDDSGPFVNGILDNVKIRSEKGEIESPPENAGDPPRV